MQELPMEVDAPSIDADFMSKLQKFHTETMSNLQVNLDSLAGTPPGGERDQLIVDSSIALSTLKLLQRQISLRVENHHAAVAKEERTKVEACSLMLQNLNYERDYLRREIEALSGWKAEDLEKMAGDELGLDVAALGNNQEKTDGSDVQMTDDVIANPEEAIDSYFFGDLRKSHRDPANHDAILSKLQDDKETRASLVEELSKSKLELKGLQSKREELHSFLVQIPKKLGEMNKVGESLSGFFKGCKAEWLCIEGDGAEKKIQAANTLVCPPSLRRTDRFQLAQSNLASPLYVLFIQLVGYVDAWSMVEHLDNEEKNACNLQEFAGADGMTVEAVRHGDEGDESSTWNVELTLPTVNILPTEIASLLGRTSKAGGDSIKIVFSYDTIQGVVKAQVKGAKDNNDVDLLDNLFPGDDGSVSPNVPSDLVNIEEDAKTNDSNAMEESNAPEEVSSSGKPYHWCQVLSGLNFPPASSRESTGIPLQVNVCTKAVFRQLLRRIRARRSLAALLEFLGRRSQNLPIHPAFRRDENMTLSQPKAKVVSWVEEKDNHSLSYSPTMKRFFATIKRKSSTLKASVVIDMQNYPAEPPVWSLQSEDGITTGSPSLQHSPSTNKAPPLFDATLHRIESHVNTDLDQFVTQEAETTYDWILIHQLVDILSCWDDMMSVSEGNPGKGGKANDSRRVRKGRDRRLVGFGEHSPFFYYRSGL
jgi:hypothetical protein